VGGQRILQTYGQTLSEDCLPAIEAWAFSSDDQRPTIDSFENL